MSSNGERLLGQEIEIPSEEEEEETYFKLPITEEPKVEDLEEELENPILEPYISYEESTMVGEGEGEVHNVNGERPRIGGGVVK